MNRRHLIASALVLAASAAAAAESPMHESIVRERPMNFDEAKVKPFALPDVLTFADGTKVTRETWARRRQEMLAILSREMLGAEPPKPDVLELEASTNVVVCAGFGLRRNYRMWFRKDRSGPYVDWTVWLPNRPLVQNAESGPSYVNPLKGVPVVLMLNYSGNHAYAEDAGVPLPEWPWVEPGGPARHFVAKESDRGSALRAETRRHLPLHAILARGYALMTACYEQIAPDNVERMYDGVLRLWPRDRDDSPRAIGAWAWALSRGLDLAERIPEIDARKSVVTGSSRLGKTALVAAARDERFAVCVPNQTGKGGSPLWKRDFGENLSMFFRKYSRSWWVPSFVKYAHDESKLPFDMHFLVAAVAPRPLLVESWTDPVFDPRGEFLSLKAASPAWELLTGTGLPAVAYPESYGTSAIGARLGFVHRGGYHGISALDWDWMLDFADSAFGSKR